MAPPRRASFTVAIRHSRTWVWVAMTLSKWSSGLKSCETLQTLWNIAKHREHCWYLRPYRFTEGHIQVFLLTDASVTSGMTDCPADTAFTQSSWRRTSPNVLFAKFKLEERKKKQQLIGEAKFVRSIILQPGSVVVNHCVQVNKVILVNCNVSYDNMMK